MIVSQEKIKEFIKEQHAIDGMVSIHDFELWLEEQPKVGNWIPCSERLPEPKREEVVRSWYIVTLATSAVVEKCFDFIKKEWVTDIEVIAWMPLPEPFKEGGAE